MEVEAEAGEHFGLPVVGKVADEAVVEDFGDEVGGGDAAVLEGWRKRGNDGFCEWVADAAPGGRVGKNFGGFEDFSSLTGRCSGMRGGLACLRAFSSWVGISAAGPGSAGAAAGAFFARSDPSRNSSWAGSRVSFLSVPMKDSVQAL